MRLFYWAWFVTPPVFGTALSLTMRVHYTMLFDICQILNKIHHEDLAGTKKKRILAAKRDKRNNESVFAEATPDRCRRVDARLRRAFYKTQVCHVFVQILTKVALKLKFLDCLR